jgi:hypothetical protein
MEDRSLAEATLALQIELVIPLQFCPSYLLGRTGQRQLCNPSFIQESDKVLCNKDRIGPAVPVPAFLRDERDRLRFVQSREPDAVRLHHLGEGTNAAQILYDRALRVALAEKVPLELVQVISEKLDCDVMSPLARYIRVHVHFWLLRFEEAQFPGESPPAQSWTQHFYAHAADTNGTTAGAADGREHPNHGRDIFRIPQMLYESASHGDRRAHTGHPFRPH